MIIRFILIAIALCGSSGRLHAQDRGGELRERVTSSADPSQQYAVYLPAGYDTLRTWPLAVLMDPRGRALVPLGLAREAADRYGFVLVSSYNTLSDGAAEPNFAAVRAIVADSRALRVDRRRIYLVGFSGTARLAWNLAVANHPVRGIMGVGGSGITFSRSFIGTVPRVDYYGIVGNADYNHDEYRLFAPWLQRLALPHRLRVFEGPHSWPPAAFMDEALGWFTLRAMRAGEVPRDDALVARLFRADSAAADSLLRVRAHADAQQRWREIADDYGELHDVTYASRRAHELDSDSRVRADRERQAREVAEFGQFVMGVDRVSRIIADAPDAPRVRDLLRQLDLSGLQRAARSRDPYEAAAAQRRLAHIYSQQASYTPRPLLDEGKPARALIALEIAEATRGGTAQVSLLRARALVQLGRPADAITALEEAVQRGAAAAPLAQAAAFASLRNEPRFRALTGSGS